MSELKWTRKTTENIAKELTLASIPVGKTTVGKVLKELNFSLRTNSKKISNGGKSVTEQEQLTRDNQFKYIHKKREEFIKKGFPVISVDTKKKEIVGNFKNSGKRYRRIEDLVNDHDFAKHAIGKAAPYGIYDQKRNEGFVYVGQFLWDGKKFTSSDTSEFAAESIAKWFKSNCIRTYPHARELLILADGGGSNRCNSNLWKVQIQNKICNKYGVAVTVCHYPPGASKWNSIEHRLFSEISKNWAGTPLRDFETVLKYIRSTKTKTGLKVKSFAVKKQYKKGMKVLPEDLGGLKIHKHTMNSKWNYTIYPA